MEHKCLNASFVMPDVVLVKKVQGTEKDDAGPEKVLGKVKSGRAKKREKRNKREEKKARELEEAAGRMGFLEQDVLIKDQFEDELINDPDLAEELLAVERELAEIDEDPIEPDVAFDSISQSDEEPVEHVVGNADSTSVEDL